MSWRLKWLLPIILLVLAFISLSSSLQKNKLSSETSNFAFNLFAPIEEAFSSTTSWFINIWHAYFNLVDVKKENEYLKALLERQNLQVNQLLELKHENENLIKLLDFKSKLPQNKILATKVIARDPNPWFKTVIIDAGTSSGIAIGQAVFNNNGLIGQVVAATSNYGKVLLLQDINSSVDAIVQRTRANAIISGEGDGDFILKYLKKDEDLRPGDLIISSGLDGIFPPGMVIGTVSYVDKNTTGIFIDAKVAPSANLNHLDNVLVMLDKKTNFEGLTKSNSSR